MATSSYTDLTVKGTRRTADPRSMRRFARLTILAFTVGAVALTGTATALGPGGPVAADGAAPQPVVTSPANLQLLQRVSLQPDDLVPSAQIQPYQEATTVRGQVSLDLCGAAFASEALRIGRYQVGVFLGQEQALSVEAILYRDAASAKQALSELVRAKRLCPKSFVADGVVGQPPIEHHFNRVPRVFAAVPGVQRVTLDITETDQQGNRGITLSLYQRRGSIIVAMYGSLPLPPSDGSIAGSLADLADTLGRRLLAAPQPSSTV
jgi:hypothetical protein